ncbi:hypothetical protein IIA15_01145, partial [candidate division TA06 bacterium]|nr:hypothetical protein [candidate division TA06 bacterium]
MKIPFIGTKGREDPRWRNKVNFLFDKKVWGLLFLLWGLLHSKTTAQPVIDANEFPTDIGLTQEYLSGGPYDFGFPLPGSAPWDFSSGPTTDTFSQTYINKSGALFADSFPNADFALRIPLPEGAYYVFLSKSPTVLLEHGVSLLDSFFDNNERKYYISQESVERAVDEVKARKIRLNQLSANVPKEA